MSISVWRHVAEAKTEGCDDLVLHRKSATPLLHRGMDLKHTPQAVHLQPAPQLQLLEPEQLQGPIVLEVGDIVERVNGKVGVSLRRFSLKAGGCDVE